MIDPQEMPKQEGGTSVVPLVIGDLKDRAEKGKEKYGRYLHTHNGRDALIDLYQELLDGVCYLRQYLEEQE